MRADPLAARLLMRLYRALLRLYPPAYRRAFADEQARTFADLCRAARGRRDLAALGLRGAADLLAAIAHERATEEWHMNRHTWLIAGLAIALAVFLGYIDQKMIEVQGTLLFLLPFGFLLGLLGSRGAWRWALILGLSIPVAGVLARALGIEPAGLAHARAVTGQPLPFTYGQALTGVIALIPAFLAVYAGAAVQRLVAGRARWVKR
jgi:hypothetical protein